MNIVIANQKGGVGKTTLSILLATYLALEKKKECLILDMDFQSSIKTLWDQDNQNFGTDPLFEILELEMKLFPDIKDQLSQVNGAVIIDLPGKMDDNGFIPVFQAADLVVCPFTYDKITFESTSVFAAVVRHINTDVPLLFVPNKIKSTVRYELKRQVDDAFEKIGVVTPVLPDRIDFQRLTTRHLPVIGKEPLLHIVELILKQIKKS